MALLFSSLAQVCRGFGLQVSAAINGANQSTVRVLIGTPSVAAPAEADSDHRLNLFFFRVENSGFDAGMLPGDPWLLRMHCLATPFCCDEPPTTAGENDLRILGELLRHIHENPVSEMTLDGATFLIQTIFLNLGLDQINQLWSTQGDTVYRPSVLFEISLAPVLPRTATIPGPLVTGLGLDARAVPLRRGEGLGGIAVVTPPVRPTQPDTSAEDWAPALALVNGADGGVHQALSLQLGSAALAGFAPRLWLAGKVGAGVTARWETWERTTGWQTHGVDASVGVSSSAIDPEQVPAPADLPATTLPFNNRPGQMMLYAVRDYIRAADGAHVTVRSNPVLVNLFTGTP